MIAEEATGTLGTPLTNGHGHGQLPTVLKVGDTVVVKFTPWADESGESVRIHGRVAAGVLGMDTDDGAAEVFVEVTDASELSSIDGFEEGTELHIKARNAEPTGDADTTADGMVYFCNGIEEVEGNAGTDPRVMLD